MSDLFSSEVMVNLLVGLVCLAVGLIVGWLMARRPVGSKKPATARRRKDSGGERPANRQGSDNDEIYVGNLSYDATEDDIKQLFAKFGAVASVRLIANKFNGKSKGYSFVCMRDGKSADKAIDALNGAEVGGRKIVVNRAKSKGR